MTEFYPDTCECVIVFNRVRDTFIFVDWINKCEIHKDLDGQNLLDQILIHNQNENNKFGKFPNAPQREKLKRNKRLEKLRIRKLGKGRRKFANTR